MRDWMNIVLMEGRDAPLYHATELFNALGILKHNRIDATVHHNIPLAVPLTKKGVFKDKFSASGVSLTRVKSLAYRFSSIVFVLDQRLLSYNKKLYPIDFWVRDQESHRASDGGHNEAEEFIIGSIFPLDRYLVSIEMSQKTLNKIKSEYSNTEILLAHPKLTITY